MMENKCKRFSTIFFPETLVEFGGFVLSLQSLCILLLCHSLNFSRFFLAHIIYFSYMSKFYCFIPETLYLIFTSNILNP